VKTFRSSIGELRRGLYCSRNQAIKQGNIIKSNIIKEIITFIINLIGLGEKLGKP